MNGSIVPPFRRIWWRIVPLMMFAYTASYLDRVNLSFGAEALRQALRLDERQFGLGAGLFFVGYICVQVPSNMLLARFGPRRTISVLMLAWGGLSLLFAFVRTVPEFMVLRVLLGAAEAGFYPGMIVCLTYWFPKARLGAMTSSFLLAIPLSGIIGAPLSMLLLTHCDGVFGLQGWQWMFLIEALPTLLLGVLVAVALPDGPHAARWLTTEEKNSVARALAHQADRTAPEPAWRTLRSPLILWLVMICFCQAFTTYGISFWFPTVIGDVVGHDVTQRTLWTTFAFGLAGSAMVANSLISDRRRDRLTHLQGPFWVVALALGACFYLAAMPGLMLALLILALCAQYAVIALVFTLCATLLPKERAAAGIAWVNSLGAFGGLLGPYAVGWVRTATHDPAAGLLAIGAAAALGGILVQGLRRHLLQRAT